LKYSEKPLPTAARKPFTFHEMNLIFLPPSLENNISITESFSIVLPPRKKYYKMRYQRKDGFRMNIQIYGSKKSFDTKKAERYFKERKIKYQYIDLHQFGMAKAVFEAAKKCIPVEDMIDRKAKAYTRLYMDYIDEAKREQTLFENPELFATPIVRNGKAFTLGYCPDIWKDWE
jgi:arsenate reductase